MTYTKQRVKLSTLQLASVFILRKNKIRWLYLVLSSTDGRAYQVPGSNNFFPYTVSIYTTTNN